MTRKRKWLLRGGLGLVFVLGVVSAWAAMNATALKVCYASHQLRTATTEDDRARAAERLLALGAPGFARLVEFIRAGDDDCRSAATAAINRCLTAASDGDQRAVIISAQLFDAFGAMDDRGRQAALDLVPLILKTTGSTFTTKCRESIVVGLKSSEPAVRVLAARLALHPDLKMRRDLLPLLCDPELTVRRAALFGVSSIADGEQVMTDEELFHWLHDPDEGMRKICYDALVGRDRSEVEIGLARRLSHPDPLERLKLLLDLRYDDDVADPEPWLERLSRDPEPAVRVGAARVVLEVTALRGLVCPVWVAQVADGDPDATVRRIADYFRRNASQSGLSEVRPVNRP